MMEADLSMSSGVVKAIFDVTKVTTLFEIANISSCRKKQEKQ